MILKMVICSYDNGNLEFLTQIFMNFCSGDPHAGKNALVVKDSAEKCVPLTSIQNGYVSYVPYGLPPYNPGTIATLGCVTGYAPVGPTIARCAQGSWTIIGDCQPIREQKCPPIATVYNGHVRGL